jgi:hypothetical protein
MAERQRMTAEEVVAKLMSDEHADLLRESLRWRFSSCWRPRCRS